MTEVSPWLERTQWIRHLEGQDRGEVMKLIRAAKDEEPELQEVEKSFKRLIEKARQTIVQKKVSTFTLHRVQSFQAGEDSNKPFHVNLNRETLDRYQRVWYQLLFYILRTADTESRLYQISDTQHTAVRNLLLAAGRYQMYELDELGEEEMEVINEEMDQSCLQLCIKLLDHRLDHDEYESGIISYLAAAALELIPGDVEVKYKFRDAMQYTPILSGFLKVAQMLTIQYCLEEEIRGGVNSCRELLEELHSHFMVVGTATPMNWVLRLRLYGRAIGNKKTADGNINWVEETVIYKEIELSMIDFRRLVHKLAEETRAILIEELLFAKDHEEVIPKYHWSELKDNPAKDEPGWYFIHDRRNGMQEQSRWLLNRVLQIPRLSTQFIHQDTGIWRQQQVNDYLDRISTFMERLLVLIHMTAGQPARSREWLSVRYCNTEKGGHRCIFIENGLMVIVTYYDKGYNITGTQKIIHRYLPQEVGELLLLYIWLVLPMRQQLQQLVFNDTEIPTPFLWSIDRRKKWTPDRVKDVIKRESDRLIGVPLNIASYRQIAIAISNRYMKRTRFEEEEKKEKDEDEQHDDAVARQSGHTQETAGAIYARHIEEAPSHIQHMRYRFRVSSTEWHQVLQFATWLEERGSRLGGDLKRIWKGEHEKSLGPRFRRWQKLRQTNLTEVLQQLMGVGTQFRGKQQEALQAIMENKSPIILVMRTGGGKSLMFILPASVQEAGTTVVVTPLIALKQDMQRRCRELGLECQAWTARKKMHDSCILLVTPESAVSQGFMNHLRKLQAMDRLDRIVIDECHVLLNTRLDFRRKLQKLRKMVEFTVQLVLLTATLPPSKESELLSMISIEAPHMFRDMTTRHNIVYAVQQHKTKDIDKKVTSIVKSRQQQYGNGRVIVYGGRIEHCQSLAETLDCRAYYSEADNKDAILQDWLNGITNVIVATNALGLGIDVPNVRLVLHAEPSFDLLNYAQESGRAGRDGEKSEAIVLIAEERIPRKYKNIDERLLWEYLITDRCRRVKLDQYLDGNFETISCVAMQEECDNCWTGIEKVLDEEIQESNVSEEEDINDEDMGMMIAATEKAELAEYEEQRQQRKRQQLQYRQSRITAADDISELEKTLDKLRDRCICCYYHDMKDAEEHVFATCKWGHDMWEIYREAKEKIKYTRYAACWGCGCPQWICGEYLPGGERQCQYRDIVLAGVVVGVMDKTEKKGRQRVFELAEQEFEREEDILKWLGEMAGIHGKQTSNAAIVFNMLFN